MVAPTTGQNAPPSPAALNCSARETSPWPAAMAATPMTTMISRPVSSTQVSSTLSFTLSPTPRKLTAATSAMKASAIAVMPMPPAESSPKATCRLAAKAREAVDAEVMPEHITAKATMNVRNWMPNALWT